MVRKSQRHKQRKHPEDIDDRHVLDRKAGILLRRVVRYDENGKVVSYGLAYINPMIAGRNDNGRVLGYDNDHGYHHRHHFGVIEPVEFESYEEIEARFEAEFREIHEDYKNGD